MSAVATVAIPEPNTAAWEQWRRGGLGSSEVAATLGEHPHMTERALALRKRGLAPDVTQTAAMSWGHRMEEVGAQEYAARTGRTLLPSRTVTNARWPHLYATPDRFVQGERRGVELKWTRLWDEPPRHVRMQALGQMGIGDLDMVDVVRMGPYGEPTWTTIVPRDDQEVGVLLDWAEEWFCRFVLGDELPDPDGSEASIRYAQAVLGAGPMDATDEQSRLMGRLRQARQDADAAAAEEALVRDLLCRSMAGHDEVRGSGFRVLWRESKGRTTTDWKAVANGLGAIFHPSLLRLVAADNTRTGAPTHPFLPKWDEEGS